MKTISAFELIGICSLIIVSVLSLADVVCTLRAAIITDQISARCASAAAGARTKEEAIRAVNVAIDGEKPDGFFLRQPISGELLSFYGVEETKVLDRPNQKTPFASVKVSVPAWVPAPYLFVTSVDQQAESDSFATIVPFSSIGSYGSVDLSGKSP
ncbi:MAG TPA: hypothetical protein V6D17_23420 [Candidatus Obscuribacterales bacterium]